MDGRELRRQAEEARRQRALMRDVPWRSLRREVRRRLGEDRSARLREAGQVAGGFQGTRAQRLHAYPLSKRWRMRSRTRRATPVDSLGSTWGAGAGPGENAVAGAFRARRPCGQTKRDRENPGKRLRFENRLWFL